MSDGLGTYAEQFGEAFQQHILAVALLEPDFAIRYRTVLDYNYFTSDVHRLIAKALLSHVDEWESVPTQPTLVEDLREIADDEAFRHAEKSVAKLYRTNIPDSAAVRDRIIQFGKNQALFNAVLESAEMLANGNQEKIRPLIDDAYLVGEDILDLGIAYNDLDARMRYYLEEEQVKRVVPTGIQHLDYAMGGGLRRGELGVVLAPPKRGKSTTLINFGIGALLADAEYSVAHYTLEMPEPQVMKRYDDRLVAGAFDATRKNMDKAKYVEAIREAHEAQVKGKLFIKGYKTRGAGVSTIRSHLAFLRAQGFTPDVLLVDYADILRAERRLGEMRHEQAGNYEDLRTLAGEFDCAVWTASQASSGALEKERLDITDFAEAFEKSAIVDSAVAYCQTFNERVDGLCRLVGIAMRDVEDGFTVQCQHHRQTAYIESTLLMSVEDVQVQTPFDDDADIPETTTVREDHNAEKPKRKPKRVKGASAVAMRLKRQTGVKTAKVGTKKTGGARRVRKKAGPSMRVD